MRLKIRILILFILMSITTFVSSGVSIENTMRGTLARPIYTLTVTGSGAGTGTVVSNVYGINCTSTAGIESGTCSAQIISGTSVILTATAIPGHSFVGWTGSGCSGMGTCTIAMDGNKTVDANFLNILPLPQLPNLIGWYKFDEGIGFVAHNSATDGSLGGGLFPDLDVVNVTGDFWSAFPGFGSVQLATTTSFARKHLPAIVAFNGPSRSCVGAFFRRKLNPTAGGDVLSIHVGDVGVGLGVGVSGNGIFSNLNGELYGGQVGGVGLLSNQTWYFYFLINPGLGYVVKPDGTLATSLGFPVNNAGGFNIDYLHVGVRYTFHMSGTGYFGAQGAFGDIIIYNFRSLSLSEWAIWYDTLRARYGMAARSGW